MVLHMESVTIGRELLKELIVVDLTGKSAAPFEHRDSDDRIHRLETYRGSRLLMIFHRHLG